MDEQGQLNYEQASTHSGYQKVKSDIPNFGITEAAVWLKLNLRNVGEEEEYLFQITQPGLDELRVYFKEPSGKVWSREAGEHLSFGQRTFHDPNYIFKLRIPQGEIIEVFLRVKARDNVQVPMQVGTYEAVFETNKTRDLWVGIYVGLMLVMLVYNLFIYFTVRDKAYLYYIIYIGAVILTQVSILGYTFPYLWPDSPKMAYFSSFIFPPLVGVTSAIFMRAFLHTAELLPRMDKFWLLFAGGYVVSVILALSGFFPASFQLIEVCAMGLSLFMMAEAIVLYRRGSRPAGFFLVAWSIFLIGVSVYVMKDLGVLPYNNFTLYTMPIGSALEVVLLSFALADRINILQQENEQVQAEKIAALRENERLVSEQNVILERKVHERTLQLEETNTELSTTLNHLKETQAQLVDAEKMASLGQLTAGIAHEINNPINFVSANVNPLRRDFQDILEVLGKYEHLDPDHDIRKQLKEIEKYKEQIDMKFIPEEIMSLLQGIEHGASRTAEIVKGLKNFSRLDESDIKDADVNEGIESTLTLLKHTFPPNLKLETYFAPLGMIECYPGKLNQVFMNVLNNGIQAMAKMEREEHVLSIQTLEENQQVVIKIKDTGIGMTPEVKAKVFEPFFTTKDVGEGTGLGMSIVFKIIESHHGKIELESKPGQGTLVTIRLNRRISTKA
jgi:signal transduction histidine kinase